MAQLWIFRPLRMRLLISAFLFLALLAVGCGRSSSSVTTDTGSGQKIVRDVSTNGGTVLTRTAIASGPNPAADYDAVHDGDKVQATFS